MRSKSKHQNQCAVCAGKLKDSILTHEERRGDQLYLFQNVPTQVCSTCDEIWIDEAVLREIDELIESGEPVREVKTPVVDFASTSDLLK
jgi:YgiT-type zinc finger domain-containing protein